MAKGGIVRVGLLLLGLLPLLQRRTGGLLSIAVGVVAGATALVALSHITLLIGESGLGEWNRLMLSYLGDWLLPSYVVMAGFLLLSLPLGLAAGALLHRTSPHFMLIAVGIVWLPFFALAPGDPFVHFGPLLVGLSMWLTSVVVSGRLHRRRRSAPTPYASRDQSRRNPDE